jgi:glutamate racemase
MTLLPNEKSLPIGIFDSGVGGLTVAAAIRRRLPDEHMLYLGDVARLPYGTKSPGTVIRYALQAADYLVEQGIKMLVLACNTASAHALDAVRAKYAGLPVLGVIAAGARAAAARSACGRIVVAATEGTCASEAFPNAIMRARPDAVVRQVPCPMFVALAEEGLEQGPIAEAMVRSYLAAPLADADCLVLGCTHFPLLKPALRNVFADGVRLVDCADEVAVECDGLLTQAGLRAPAGQQGAVRLVATDAPRRFAGVAGRFFPELGDSPGVDLVDL